MGTITSFQFKFRLYLRKYTPMELINFQNHIIAERPLRKIGRITRLASNVIDYSKPLDQLYYNRLINRIVKMIKTQRRS
jgi:hypothetical protein